MTTKRKQRSKKNIPFAKPKRQATPDDFDVSFETSSTFAQSQDSSHFSRKINPFKKPNSDLNISVNAINEVSSNVTNSSQLSSLSTNKIKLFHGQNAAIGNPFDVTNEISNITDDNDSLHLPGNKMSLFRKSKPMNEDAFDISDKASKSFTSSQNSSYATCTKINPFNKQKGATSDGFNVSKDMSTSFTVSHNTPQFSNIKLNPFSKKKEIMENSFDISKELSKNFTDSQNTSNFLSAKKKPFNKPKSDIRNSFNITKDMTQSFIDQQHVSLNISDAKSFAKPNPFKKIKTPTENAFNISKEESRVLTDRSNMSDILSNKKMPFGDHNLSGEGTFQITNQKEDSLETNNSSFLGNKVALFNKANDSPQEKDTLNVNFEESTVEDYTDITGNNPKAKNIFQKESKLLNNSVSLSFDDFSVKNDSQTKHTNSTMKQSEDSVLRCNNVLDTTCNNSISINHKPISNEKTDTSQLLTNSSKLSNHTSFSKTGTIKSTRTDLNNTSLSVDQSFDDDNLNVWMSDHSNEDIDVDESAVKSAKDMSIHEKDNLEMTSYEDREIQLKEKWLAIVNTARESKKVSEMTPVAPKVMHKEIITKKNENKKRNTIQKLRKPASFVTKRLYQNLIKKLEPIYGIHAVLKSEEIVMSICETVKIVLRRKAYQKKLINDLKVEMAKMKLIECTYDFYDFVREYLPYEFREKVIPCIQPITNIVYPPKDAKNPFDKILC